MRQRGMLAKVRLVGKMIAVENSGGTLGTITRTMAEDMGRIAAVHATRYAKRVSAVKVGGGVARESSR